MGSDTSAVSGSCGAAGSVSGGGGGGVAAIASEDFREYAGLAQTGLGLLFLKFSRDDEREADDLGLRYMVRGQYNPYEMPKVFDTLDRVSAAQGGGRVPGWLATHPAPANRAARISEQVARARSRMPPTEGNALAVRLELQADCFAGVWGHHAATKRQLLEEGDVEEGLRAAAAIGDDTLQRQAQGYVVPESFTHGTAKERASWLMRGLKVGTIEACDTFATSR